MKDHADIPVSPEALWPYVADPLLMARWNSKLVSIDRQKTGPVTCGERYDELRQMGGKERLFHVEVADVLPGQKVTYRQTMDGQNGYALETFSLSHRRGGTRITQHVDLSHGRVSVVVRMLIAVLHTLGRPVEEKMLDRLRRVVAKYLDGHCACPCRRGIQ